MQNEGLSLFNIEDFDSKTAVTKTDTPKIPEEKIVAPVFEVLESITPGSEAAREPIDSATFKKSLDDLFPEQQYDEKRIQKAKEVLGKTADEFTPNELKDAVNVMQFLAESWLDDFEKKIFKGMTLKEVLHEKGGR